MTRRWIVLLAAAVALGLAGCGSGDSDDSVASVGDGTTATAKASPSADQADQMVKFTQCLREHGVDIKDPAPGEPLRIMGKPGTEATMNAAMEACKEYNPQADAAGGAEADQRNQDFAKCMRENGVEAFPDPEPGQKGVRINPEVGEDPDFQGAQEKCESLLAGGPR